MAVKIKEVKLEKGMYQTGKSFTQVLEEQDPSSEYKGSEHEGLDAFQRQLKRLGIRVKGVGSDSVEKFFQTFESSVLFPEYISRTVREGLEQENILPDIIATTTLLDTDTYRSIYMDTTEDDKGLKRVGEGGTLPKTTIRTKEQSVDIFKFGRLLEVSYEAIRRKKLDVFSVFLRQIGAQIAKDQLKEAVNVIINGDGNGNAATEFKVGTAPISGAAGALAYDQVIEFWSEFDPYEMNTILAPKDMMIKILKMEEFKDPQAGFNFQKTGELVSPLGAKLKRTSALAAGSLIGMDKRYVLEHVVEQHVTTEFDKLIDKQLERTAITQVAGFSKLFQEPAKVLKLQ